MVDFYLSRRLDFSDFPEVEVVGHILIGIMDILEYMLLPRLEG